MPIVDAAVEAYTEAHTTPLPALFDAIAEQARRFEAPGMLVGPVEGRFLETLVRAAGARRVLEIGTFCGYSALSMAAGLPPDGTIVSCEVHPPHAEAARRFVAESPYAGRIEVRLGPALDTVASLDGPFDLVFIDADKTNYANYFEAVLPKLAPAGLIVVDNTLWSGRVLDDADLDDDTVAIRSFNDLVAKDPRVTCVLLPVRDGVTLVTRA
ncbi:MAG TPA: O-methyltransferase [Acidimicrobiales bacterium]|nr:O-methyltransferase [Acidimicrobiales bacterium]